MTADHDGSAPEPPAQGESKWWQRVRPAVLLVVGGVFALPASSKPTFGLPVVAIALTSGLAFRGPHPRLRDRELCVPMGGRSDRTRHACVVPPIGATQLNGSAVGHVLPGGGATSIAATASMLRRAGIAEPGETATAFGAAAVLQMATTFVLPVFALPAILRRRRDQPQPGDCGLSRRRRIRRTSSGGYRSVSS